MTDIDTSFTYHGIDFRITTRSSASSYGQPVLIPPDGLALGPGDAYETPTGWIIGDDVLSAWRQATGP